MAEDYTLGKLPASGPGAAVDPNAPLEQRLVYGSEFHSKILTRLRARRELAERHITDRYDDWNRVDEHCRLFIDLSRRARKANKQEDPSKKEMPFERAIVIPLSLAILTVRLTQLMAIFTSREPMLQLEGRGPEDVPPAKLMEALLAYDLQQTLAVLALYALLQDAEKYGLGVVHDCWEQQHGVVMEQPATLARAFAPILRSMGLESLLAPRRGYGLQREFNRWTPVDPFHYWPDPRVPVSQVQQGEFVGHREFHGWMHLQERKPPAGPYFNLDALKKLGAQGQRQATSRARFAKEAFTLLKSTDDDDPGFYAIDHLQVKLIPKDWQLGPGEQPEIWWFSMADEACIIRAHPSEYLHGQFTYAVGESVPDEHAPNNPGQIENLDGIQRVVDWLVNSHIENVRKHLNDAVIYAPSLIEEADLLNSGPARHIRLTLAGEKMLMEGRLTFPQMLMQLPWADVTGQHLKTVNVLFDMAQRLAATSDPQMSQTTDDERTLGEVKQVIASSSQRLAITARLLDGMALQPLALRAVANRQQFTSQPQFIRVTGDLAKELGQDRLEIHATDVAGNFDYVPHTGVVPPDPERFAGVWAKLLEAYAKVPQLQAPTPDGKMLSAHEIFNRGAQAMGVKDAGQLYVESNAAVAAQLQAGNLIPAEGQPANGKIPGAGIQTPITPVGVDLRGQGNGAA